MDGVRVETVYYSLNTYSLVLRRWVHEVFDARNFRPDSALAAIVQLDPDPTFAPSTDLHYHILRHHLLTSADQLASRIRGIHITSHD